MLTRRALARINHNSNTKTTSVDLEVDGDTPADDVCNDAAEGSINTCNTAGSADKNNNGALQAQIRTDNGPTKGSFTTQPQRVLCHQGDDEENRDGLRTTQQQTDELSGASSEAMSHEEKAMSNAPLPSVKDKKFDGRIGDKKKHGVEAAVSKPHPATSVSREVVSVANAKPDIESDSVWVEREDGVSKQDKREAPPSQSEDTLRRSQRVRRPTQRHAAGMGNDSGKRKRNRMDDDECQEATKGQRRSKKRKNEPSGAGEDSAEGIDGPKSPEEVPRDTYRQSEEPSSTNRLVWGFQNARIPQEHHRRRYERWMALIDVVTQAKKIETAWTVPLLVAVHALANSTRR